MALRRRGVDPVTSRKVAWPLVEHAAIQGLDPALVVSVVLVESSGKPTARSPVGARGLMQVMPFWAGHWSECGTDLYDIAGNLCYGTRILSEYLARFRGDAALFRLQRMCPRDEHPELPYLSRQGPEPDGRSRRNGTAAPSRRSARRVRVTGGLSPSSRPMPVRVVG